MLPRPTLEAFDAWLTSRSLQLEATVVGGSALALLGVTERQTRDVLTPTTSRPPSPPGPHPDDRPPQRPSVARTSHRLNPHPSWAVAAVRPQVRSRTRHPT